MKGLVLLLLTHREMIISVPSSIKKQILHTDEKNNPSYLPFYC